MKGKGRVYAVVGDLMEWFEREWKNRQALWLGLTVLIVVLLQFQILASVNKINRTLHSVEYEMYRIEAGMELIGEHVGISSSDWPRGRRWRSNRR